METGKKNPAERVLNDGLKMKKIYGYKIPESWRKPKWICLTPLKGILGIGMKIHLNALY